MNVKKAVRHLVEPKHSSSQQQQQQQEEDKQEKPGLKDKIEFSWDCKKDSHPLDCSGNSSSIQESQDESISHNSDYDDRDKDEEEEEKIRPNPSFIVISSEPPPSKKPV